MKKWISLFLAALLVVGMAACSAPAAAPDAQAGQAQADQPEASGEEMVVVEAYIVQPDWSDAWDVMEARFEEQYPWIDVESVGMGASASDFISTRASVNDLPDVTQIDNNYMWQTLCDEGNIMDLTGRDVCQYIPQSYLDAYTYNGQLIENFSIRFHEGKAVEVHAEKNEEMLKTIISMDEGASYLGEVALVPYSSPINRLGYLFYNTLFDENAVCHLALGEGYTNTLHGFADMTREECTAAGINDSMIHEDFMIGAPDLSIVATLRDGTEKLIFKDGTWAF